MTMRQLKSGLVLGAALAVAAPSQAQQVNARTGASARGTVEITVPTAGMRITGWNRNEVAVTGTMPGGQRIELEESGGDVEVRLAGGRGMRVGGGGTLEVRVPAGSSLEVQSGAGSLVISGVTGDIEAMHTGGSVQVTGSPRSIELVSHGGPVSIDARTGSMEVTAMGGPVTIGGTASGRVEVNAMGGRVDLTGNVGEIEINAMGGPVRVASARGRVEITSVGGSVSLSGRDLRGSVESVSGNVLVVGTIDGSFSAETHSGNVELRLPASQGGTVDATTWSGSVQSDFAGVRRAGGRGEWRGSLGRGGPAISVSTFSGDVKLTRQ